MVSKTTASTRGKFNLRCGRMLESQATTRQQQERPVNVEKCKWKQPKGNQAGNNWFILTGRRVHCTCTSPYRRETASFPAKAKAPGAFMGFFWISRPNLKRHRGSTSSMQERVWYIIFLFDYPDDFFKWYPQGPMVGRLYIWLLWLKVFGRRKIIRMFPTKVCISILTWRKFGADPTCLPTIEKQFLCGQFCNRPPVFFFSLFFFFLFSFWIYTVYAEGFPFRSHVFSVITSPPSCIRNDS